VGTVRVFVCGRPRGLGAVRLAKKALR
jgi:hypothetical protein